MSSWPAHSDSTARPNDAGREARPKPINVTLNTLVTNLGYAELIKIDEPDKPYGPTPRPRIIHEW